MAGFAMRVSVFFFIAVGVGLIVMGTSIQNPPTEYAPAFMVAVGAINLFASMAGFWGSYNKKRVLMVFIILGGLSVLLQIAFEISLFFIFDKVVQQIAPSSKTDSTIQAKHDSVSKQLNIARWIALGFIFIEIITLVLAILLKWVVKSDDDTYQGFDEVNEEQRQTQLANLRGDIEHGSAKERAYDKIKDQMAAKYGGLTGGNMSAGVGDWRTKTNVSWKR